MHGVEAVSVAQEVGGRLRGAADATQLRDAVRRNVQLYGPSDANPLQASDVVRTEPRPWITNFEPNYLAIVDFDPPDFPWMLTPAKPACAICRRFRLASTGATISAISSSEKPASRPRAISASRSSTPGAKTRRKPRLPTEAISPFCS